MANKSNESLFSSVGFLATGCVHLQPPRKFEVRCGSQSRLCALHNFRVYASANFVALLATRMWRCFC